MKSVLMGCSLLLIPFLNSQITSAPLPKEMILAPLTKGGWGDNSILTKANWGDNSLLAPLTKGGWGDNSILSKGSWGDIVIPSNFRSAAILAATREQDAPTTVKPLFFIWNYYNSIEAPLSKETTLAPLTKGGWGDNSILTKGSWGDKIAQRSPTLTITVNSNADRIAPDDEITLREAIALTNGTLDPETLTESESNQITSHSTWQINFDLPPENQRIELKTALPPLQKAGLILKGDITLTPATETLIPQGLQIMGDDITVNGLTLYGFSGEVNPNRGFPIADIVIAPPESNENPAPTGVVIENTQLGRASETRSNFGIAIVAGTEVTIRKNQIQNHGGSGILTLQRNF